MPSTPRQGPFRAGKRYNAYGAFLRQHFGCRVHKVVVDAGLTCPNRDGTVGTGGCTYCSNDSFRPASAHPAKTVGEQIETGARYLRERYRAEKFIVYFQPYSNTHAPLDTLIPLYEEALAFPDSVGIAVGTRPDCIDEAKLSWFQERASQCFVTLEYGIESTYDETLSRIRRGHTLQCSLEAIQRTRNRGIWLGAHLILGFPWETRPQIIAMAETLSGRGIDFLKLHHLHVVRGSPLGKAYQEKPFPLLGYHEYRDLVVEFLERLDPSIKLERLFGQAPQARLLGPHWNRSRGEIQRGIELELERRGTCQGSLYEEGGRGAATGSLPGHR